MHHVRPQLRRPGHRRWPLVVALCSIALLAGACTSDEDFVAAGDGSASPSEQGGASGSIASDRTPDGYAACPDEYTGQSYHLCVWTLNESYGFAPRTDEQKQQGVQPQATAGTTIRHIRNDIPWGNQDAGGSGPADQTSGSTFSWRFGCRSVCGPEVTISYDMASSAPYKDEFSLWANVETGSGDDGYSCRTGRYTWCTGRSQHSDEDDYSVAATFTNNPFLVQIDSTIRGTLTKTSETSGNLTVLSSGSDPLTAPQTIQVVAPTPPAPPTPSSKISWIGGFLEVDRESNYSVSYKLSGNGALDGSSIRMNAAFGRDGSPIATKYDPTGKAITGDPRTTWCEVIKVGSANLSCRVNSVSGKPALVSFTLVP